MERVAKNQNWAKLTPWLGAVSLAALLLFLKPSDARFWALINIPLYLFHQCEEHYRPGGFKNYVNRVILNLPEGEEKVTDPKVFWINVLLVWVVFAVFGAAAFYDLGFGLLMIVFSALNCLMHIVQGIRRREWNPGLVTAGVQFALSLYAAWFVSSHGLAHAALWWTGAVLFAIAVHTAVFRLLTGGPES